MNARISAPSGISGIRRRTLRGILSWSVLWFIVVSLVVPARGLAQGGQAASYLESITEDEEGGKLLFPAAVMVDRFKDEIYIIDSRSRILIYTSDFFPLMTLDKRNAIESPVSMAIDSEGNFYVAQGATERNPLHRITVLNACLKWERDIFFAGFEGSDKFVPQGLASDGKSVLYVTGSNVPGVVVMDREGRLVDMISPEEDGRKVRVTSISVDARQRVYLVSQDEGRVYVYDDQRNFLFKFGEKGGTTGKLSRPQAIGIDNGTGRMYIVDYMRHAVTIYDGEGKFISEFGGLGWGDGWFQYPRDISSADGKGRILVADTFNHRVQVFQTKE